MFATLLRTILVYFFLMAIIRLTGKRQIGQMQPCELIAAFLLSELAALPISDISIPLINSILPIALIISLEVIISFVANRVPIIKKAVECPPSIIIKKGVIDEKEMSRVRLSVDELLSQLRLKDITDISGVEYAILEGNGQLSIAQKAENRTVTVKDMDLKKTETGITHPLVLQGKASSYNLRLIGKSKKWLNEKLGKRRIRDMLLVTIDDSGEIRMTEKQGKTKKKEEKAV